MRCDEACIPDAIRCCGPAMGDKCSDLVSLVCGTETPTEPACRLEMMLRCGSSGGVLNALCCWLEERAAGEAGAEKAEGLVFWKTGVTVRSTSGFLVPVWRPVWGCALLRCFGCCVGRGSVLVRKGCWAALAGGKPGRATGRATGWPGIGGYEPKLAVPREACVGGPVLWPVHAKGSVVGGPVGVHGCWVWSDCWSAWCDESCPSVLDGSGGYTEGRAQLSEPRNDANRASIVSNGFDSLVPRSAVSEQWIGRFWCEAC